MPNTTVPLKSGATLELQMPDFATAKKLYKTFANELKGVNIPIADAQNILGADVFAFKGPLLQLIGSDAVEGCVFDCLKACTYQKAGEDMGHKITRETFEEETVRGDWFPVAVEVIKFTLAPFFKNLGLESFLASLGAKSDSPKSETKSKTGG